MPAHRAGSSLMTCAALDAGRRRDEDPPVQKVLSADFQMQFLDGLLRRGAIGRRLYRRARRLRVAELRRERALHRRLRLKRPVGGT